MKGILTVVFVVFFFQITAVQAEQPSQQAQIPNQAAQQAQPPGQTLRQALAPDQKTCDDLRASGATDEQIAARGCCSWHGGVCGCSGARVSCCDGTLSPSCQCNRDDPVGVVN